MASPRSQTLYTIEQIELLRRLRNSGMTKEQVCEAFDSMDRLDREFGPVYSNNTLTPCAQINPYAACNGFGPVGSPRGFPAVGTGPGTDTRSDDSIDFVEDSGAGSPEPMVVNGQGPHMMPDRNGQPYEDSQLKADIDAFTKKGEKVICEEIRSFVGRYNLKQYAIAWMTGISQSYVSRFLKGEAYDMSDRSKRAIYRWYLTVKNDPSKLTQTPGPFKRQVTINESGEVVPCKRERFTFRWNHLEILESYFREDSYPDTAKRQHIADACNVAAARPGHELLEKEKVTPQMVGTWFANKRKDLKKRLEDSPQQSPVNVLMNRRGRPPKHYYTPLSSADRLPSLPAPSDRGGTQLTSHNTPHAQSPSAGLSNPTNPDPVCLAAELAAVNHSILALVDDGQGEESDCNEELSGLNIPNIKQEYEAASKCQYQDS